jgi:hypothetical protein
VTDDTGDLDRLRARLAEEDYRLKDPHPASEKLSAYQANELSPEEDDAIQEHLANCRLCAQRLLDLQRFLAPPPEEVAAERVADFETEAEWRRLRKKIRPRKVLPPEVAIAAVLVLVLAWSLYRVVSLEKQLSEPITDLQPTTLEAQGSRKGAPVIAEPRSFKLGHVAAFETLSDPPHQRYRLIFRDKEGRIQRSVEDTEEDGIITLFLPRRFLPPGVYRVEVLGLDGPVQHPIRSFEVRFSR